MDPARWQQVKQVLESALERPSADRAAYLDSACRADAGLRSEVESLVAAYEEDSGFIESAAADLFAAGLRPGGAFSRDEQGGQSAASMSLSAGQFVGPYQISRLVASGGMGAVYEAIRADDTFRKKVALKIIRHDALADGRHRDELLGRFRAERQTLANLDHPNIARLLDGGSTPDGAPFLVMEFIDGQPIDEFCETRRLSVSARLRLFRDACQAVQFAHQKLVVHRDLKPGNILVDVSGAVRLLDFGIAKLLDPDSSALSGQLTRTSAQPMTPAYASPEQIRGQSVTTATDVYSLGVVLYELLTGHRPYRLNGHGAHDLPRLICEEEPTKPSAVVTQPWPIDGSRSLTPEDVSRTREGRPERLRRRLAGDLDTIVLTALQKEPRRRYGSVEQLGEDIRRHLEGEPITARPATAGYRLSKFVRRHRVGVIAATLVVLSMAVGIVGTMWQAQRAESRRIAAERVAGFWRRLYQPPGEELFDVASVDWARRSKKKGLTLDTLLTAGIEGIPRIPEDPLMEAEMRTHMARICDESHRFEDSRGLHEDALAIRRRALGNEHPQTIESAANAGFACMMAGKWKEAQPLLSEAVEIGGSAWGRASNNFLAAKLNLGLVESKLGDKEKAEKLFREVLAAHRESGSGESEASLRAMNLLGKLLGERRQFAEAEQMLGHVAEASRTASERGPNHPSTLEAINNLASVFYQQGRLQEAADLFGELYESCRRVLNKDDELTLKIGNNRALCLIKLGKWEEAEPILENVVAAADAVMPEGDFNTALFRGNYGECLTKLGRCAEARGHLDAAFKVISQKMGPKHDATRKTLMRLVEHHEKCGSAGEAERFRAMLAAFGGDTAGK